MLYNVVLVSTVQQSESAICIHISPYLLDNFVLLYPSLPHFLPLFLSLPSFIIYEVFLSACAGTNVTKLYETVPTLECVAMNTFGVDR